MATRPLKFSLKHFFHNPALERWRSRIQPWWLARTPSERRTLTLGAIALIMIVLVMGVYLPISRERARLTESLPSLRDDYAQFLSDLTPFKAPLKTIAAQQTSFADLITTAGILATQVEVEEQGQQNARTVQMRGRAVDWVALTQLLALALQNGWRLEALDVNAAGTDPGKVGIEARWVYPTAAPASAAAPATTMLPSSSGALVPSTTDRAPAPGAAGARR